MSYCDNCGDNIMNKIIIQINCGHVFCLKCSSGKYFLKEICPKCQSIIKTEKIFCLKDVVTSQSIDIST